MFGRNLEQRNAVPVLAYKLWNGEKLSLISSNTQKNYISLFQLEWNIMIGGGTDFRFNSTGSNNWVATCDLKWNITIGLSCTIVHWIVRANEIGIKDEWTKRGENDVQSSRVEVGQPTELSMLENKWRMMLPRNTGQGLLYYYREEWRDK